MIIQQEYIVYVLRTPFNYACRAALLVHTAGKDEQHWPIDYRVLRWVNNKIELQKLPPPVQRLIAAANRPVEHFFKELRRQMACKVFNTLQQAE
jgi:hypothetical protein